MTIVNREKFPNERRLPTTPADFTIHMAVSAAKYGAVRDNATVSFEFNGVALEVTPESDINAVVHNYWSAQSSPR